MNDERLKLTLLDATQRLLALKLELEDKEAELHAKGAPLKENWLSR